MPIIFSQKAPTDGLILIKSHLSQSRSIVSDSGLCNLMGKQALHASDPIQIWSVDLRDLHVSPLSSVTKKGEWRYHVFDGNNAITEVQLGGAPGTDVSATLYGPTTSGILDALVIAEKLPETQTQSFEPRLLLIPSIPFSGLWLHSSNNESKDLVIPIPPSSISLKPFKPISFAKFDSEIKDEALETLAKINAAPGPSGGSGRDISAVGYANAIPTIFNLTPLDLDVVEPMSPDKKLETRSRLPEFMQHQQQSNWCWAAVGTSVGLLFETGEWSQCDTATNCLFNEDCCKKPSHCDVYGYLDRSLTYAKSFDYSTEDTATLDDIIQQIENHRPVCARIAWNGGGAHFMAITGYDGNSIIVQDSIFGTTSILYNLFPKSYNSGGIWTHTFYCKPS
ncbi:papain-like cysteine protease family protein [Desulforhopalus sp. 52FAK]